MTSRSRATARLCSDGESRRRIIAGEEKSEATARAKTKAVALKCDATLGIMATAQKAVATKAKTAAERWHADDRDASSSRRGRLALGLGYLAGLFLGDDVTGVRVERLGLRD